MLKKALIKPFHGLRLFNLISSKFIKLKAGFLWGVIPLAALLISIEFFDELHYGIQGAALPALRADLGLSYAEIGLLFGLPGLASTLIEPAIMLLGDTRLRKSLIVAGGGAIALATLLTALGVSFPVVLAAFAIGFPASGAFVTLSQATLMDANPGRQTQMMARWTLAGSLANLAGPLLIAAGFWLGFGWRWAYFSLAALVLVLVVAVRFAPFPENRTRVEPGPDEDRLRPELSALVKGIWELARDRRLWSWIVLLQLSDLMLDIFTGYLPLYLTDEAQLTNAETSLILSVIMLATFAADAAVIPILERFPGRSVVRISAAITGLLFVTWMILPWSPIKLVVLVALRLTTLGWYPVLQGEAYAAAPGKSGSVLALGTLGGILGSGLAWFVGWLAERAGLPAAMWLLLLGPISLALFVPKSEKE